ncbi:hypothetical protein HDE_09232 [Halotydeus destructor]|nr:hypothetical protein HDE_09232 [Halotydeus destructor]
MMKLTILLVAVCSAMVSAKMDGPQIDGFREQGMEKACALVKDAPDADVDKISNCLVAISKKVAPAWLDEIMSCSAKMAKAENFKARFTATCADIKAFYECTKAGYEVDKAKIVASEDLQTALVEGVSGCIA